MIAGRFRAALLAVSPTTRWRLTLGAVAGLLGLWLLVAPKPWVLVHRVPEVWKVRDYAGIYGWAAVAIVLVLVAALAVICPWWSRPLESAGSAAPLARAPRWFRPVVLLAMAGTFFLSLPRMNDAFWDDEELNIRTTMFGRFRADPQTGEPEFRKLTWLETVYGYQKGPNTHTLYTLCARACAEGWNALSPPREFPLVEWPFRVPALIFGMLAVATLAWMLADFGFPAAGAAAAVLLGLHPWHIRYASEARGYGLMICLIPVALVAWRRALASGRWRWWTAFAAAELALVYCYPGSLFVLVVVNAAAVAHFAFSRQGARPIAVQSGRWFCVNTFAAMGAILLMLPLFPQGKAYFDADSAHGFTAGLPWVENTAALMLGGAPWSKSGQPFSGYPEWLTRQIEHPGLFAFAACLAIGLVGVGAVRLARSGWPGAVLVAITFLCPPVTFLFAYLKKFLIYEPYVIYALPGIVACAAVGVITVALATRRLPAGRILAPAAALALIGGWLIYTTPMRIWMTAHPLQQIRESVVHCRGTLDPRDDHGILTASFSIEPYLYDAHMRRLKSANELVEVMHRADRAGKLLYLNIGMPWAARQYSPQMWSLFNNHDLFEDAVRFQGFEPSLDRLVARYKPHSADHFSFSHYADGDR